MSPFGRRGGCPDPGEQAGLGQGGTGKHHARVAGPAVAQLESPPCQAHPDPSKKV